MASRVAASSPPALNAVLSAVAKTAARLCEARDALILLVEGEHLRLVAHHGLLAAVRPLGSTHPLRITGPLGRALIERRIVHVRDMARAVRTRYPDMAETQRRSGSRTVLAAPMFHDGVPIGGFIIRRAHVRPFSARQISLLKSFADQAALAIENARLSEELEARNRTLTEALEQQTATSEILAVISGSPTDIQPVLDAMATSAARLCDAFDASIFRVDDSVLRLVAHCGPLPTPGPIGEAAVPLVPGTVNGRAILERQTIHVADLQAETERFPEGSAFAARLGQRTQVSVPLLKDGAAIGTIALRRQEVRPFTGPQLQLLKTFADQAVIAIENVRLFTELQARNRELSDALEQQTATSQILRVISNAHTDAQPVFDTIVQSAVRLCKATNAAVFRTDGRMVYHPANYGSSPEALAAVRARYPRPLDMDTTPGIAILTRSVVHVPDIEDPAAVEFVRQIGRLLGFRSVVTIPMLREGDAVGALVVARREPGRFSDAEVELLQTFSDQAVIAIENVRLFTELQARNRELSDALEQQTATADILRVISSSPTDVHPTFKAIAASAAKLCEAQDGAVFRFDGTLIHLVGQHRSESDVADVVRHVFPLPPGRGSVTARAILTRAATHVPDIATDPEYGHSAMVEAGFRSVMSVPMLREGDPIGAITVSRRGVKPFTGAHVALLQTFADQAMIAIENVRLFTELQARNRQLSDALEQQTATSQILRVISSAHTDAQPVFDTIVQSAVRLCAAAAAAVFRTEGGMLYEPANYGMSPETLAATRARYPRPLGRDTTPGIAILTRSVVQVPDTEDPSAIEHVRQTGRLLGVRSMVTVPMLREGEAVGAIVVTRREPGRFSDAEVELLKTFSDQAVIAIENVRLFTELQQRNRQVTEALEQQTATSEILAVISSSPTDWQPVFDAILERALTLCGANLGILVLYDGDNYRAVAERGGTREFREFLFRPPRRPDADTAIGQAMLHGEPVQVLDVTEEPAYRAGNPIRLAIVQTGARTLLAIPMLKERRVVGAIAIYRSHVQLFTDKQIALIKTFADQAVIAIENVRLFTELQARTGQLTHSVEQLTALGDVSRALSSTLDLEAVLRTIVSRANQLAGTDACSVLEYDEATEAFHLRASHNTDDEVVKVARRTPIRKGEGILGRMAVTGEPLQIPDIAEEAAYRGPLRDVLLRTGTRALLAVPLLREDHLIGGLTVARKVPGEFPPETIDLLKTFATQSALAIQNARLFREIEIKSRQLEVASRHKSQFLANMSHELRTPLNAILGYTELIADKIYGEVPERMQEVLERVDKSGRHLLGLINDILDLSKIEAGQLTLAVADYSMADVVHSVAASVESLAAEKKLELNVTVDPDLPLGHGDQRRLTQVVLNLVGNALKFTEAGHVAVRASRVNEDFHVAVADTGPGIAESDQEKIFEEFQQAETTTRRAKGGTGLGLAIARRIIEMHGGRLWVDSAPGQGSTFTFTVPIRVEQQITPSARRATS